jgi:hypothetical protein
MKLVQKNLPHTKEIEINSQVKEKQKPLNSKIKMSVNKSQEKEPLINNLFRLINEIFIIKPGVTFDQIILQVRNTKKRILEIDQNWKLGNKYFHYVHEVVSLIDDVNISDEINLRKQRKIFRKILKATKTLRQTDQLWRMNPMIILEFMKWNSKIIMSAEQINRKPREQVPLD